MSDDICVTDIESALFAIKLFTGNVIETKQTLKPCICCPHVEGSQMFNLLRSILFTFSTVNKRALLQLVEAFFRGAPGRLLLRQR